MHTTTQKLEYSYWMPTGITSWIWKAMRTAQVNSDQMIGEDECFLVEGNTYDILLADDEPGGRIARLRSKLR